MLFHKVKLFFSTLKKSAYECWMELVSKAKRCFKPKFNRNGNTKLGKSMGTWSTLMGDDYYFIPELGCVVRGTCGGNCKGCKDKCYVRKSYNRYTSRKNGKCSVKLGHARNTLALKYDLDYTFECLSAQLRNAKNPFKIIRINQSGELQNYKEFRMWCDLAKAFPEIKFYLYTKNFNVVVPELLYNTENVPNNLTVLFSIWHEYGVKEFKLCQHLPNVKAFVYDDGFDYSTVDIKRTCKCVGYDDKGKMRKEDKYKCENCGICFNRLNSCKVIFCNEH